jgi:glutamate formiminotransferase
VTTLLAYPNLSEGRDEARIATLTDALGPGLVDVHVDRDHHRIACTVLGRPGELADALLSGARAAVALISVSEHEGVHPRVGALDVAPIVWLDPGDRGAACAEALVVADRLGAELELPVFLYGALAGGRSRAELRRGGPAELARRIAAGELRPDFGPAELHPTGGATLVAARPPLVAFNVVLQAGATVDDAVAVAAAIREGGPDGLPGVRAIGVWLDRRGVAQVSTNLEEPLHTTPAQVLAAVASRAPVAGAELVGLAPEAALHDFPSDVQLAGRATIEDALAARGGSL